MDFLYFLESGRHPVLDSIMSVITHLGGEAFFIVAALIMFWCVDKKRGYYLLTVGFLGTIINQFLKLVFRVPRPWIIDEDFTIVESARAEATGYSFPSGHTQNVTSYLGCTARSSKKTAVRVICIVFILLTSFSRMYLGVHTPMDVGVSLIIGTVLVFALYPLFDRFSDNPKFMYMIFIIMFTISAGYTIFAEVYPWSADTDTLNLASGIKNGYTICGATVGILVAYHIDRKYINFETSAPIIAQIIKVVAGLVIVVLIKSLLKEPLLALFAGHNIANSVRYFVLVFAGAGLWPMSFEWLAAKLTRK